MNDSISLSFFGDISLNGLLCDPNYFQEMKSSVSSVNQLLKNSDLVVGNWESPVSKQFNFNDQKTPVLSTTIDSSEQFTSSIRFDLFTLGNNHIGDCMDEGLETTVDFFNSHNIDTIGAGFTQPAAAKPYIRQIKNKTIGIINLIGPETNPRIHTKSTICVNYIDESNIIDQIKNLKDRVDYTILILHWGSEYNQYPSLKQQTLARQCIDNGAKVIIGHHSHCVQGIEEYNNGLICYSLGNFLFSGIKGREIFGWPKHCREGFYLNIEFNNDKLSFKVNHFTTNNAKIITEEKKSNNLKRLSNPLLYDKNWYKIIYWNNVFVTWFVKLPFFLIKVKGGIIPFLKSYMKIKYLHFFKTYFFNKKK